MADEKEPKQDDVQIKLNFRTPPRMPSVYAHHMFIQPGPNEVLLSFFEVIPPVMTEETPEERLRIVQEAGIVAECVARVTIASASFPGFAKAMQQVAEQVASQKEKDANLTEHNSES
jgi:hypothetical protein